MSIDFTVFFSGVVLLLLCIDFGWPAWLPPNGRAVFPTALIACALMFYGEYRIFYRANQTKTQIQEIQCLPQN
jgi:hypothetical protein